MDWIKLPLHYLGISLKKHAIFRAPKWTKKHKEIVAHIIKKPIYNQKYNKIGVIHDIFGPISNPFISLKLKPNQDKFTQKVELVNEYYVKMK